MDKKEHKLKPVETDWDEIKKKVREHKKQQLKKFLIILGCVLAVLVVLYVVSQVKTYSKYKTLDSIERADTSATNFMTFKHNVLKYSNDGVVYADDDNNIIWNQTFEMDSPLMTKSENYVAFADLDGQQIYVMDENGLAGSVKTNMSIKKIAVSAQGTIAVLMESQHTSYLALYNMKGEMLAEGAIHMENSGYPMDIALSADGKKLAVSILDFASGTVKTTLSFYNFGTVGQNQIDNIVNTYSYAGAVMPKLVYVDDSTMLAFADTGVMIFEGSQVPELTGEVLVSTEIKSIFYDDRFFGLIVQDPETENGRKLVIYDMHGSEIADASLDMAYTQAYFLDNHEVCIQNEGQCQIYTLFGVKKFESSFASEVYHVRNRIGVRNYSIFIEGSTEHIRCKFFSSTRFEEKTEE